MSTRPRQPVRHRIHRRALSLAMMLVALWPGPMLNAGEPGPRAEYLLKSAFLYNIAKFVDWSEHEGTSLVICITNDVFGSTIDSIVGKSVQERQIASRHLTSPQNVHGCHIIFIDMQDRRRAAEFLTTLAGEPIVTVCDQPDCARQGVMINLQKHQDKISLEMNLGAVQRTNLKFSSKLLKLAHILSEP